MNKKVLLIAQTFPPAQGIGGRRWAKFAKYLALNNHDVYVICSSNHSNSVSEWVDDVKHQNIHVFEMDSKFPKVLSNVPISFTQKVHYRIWLISLKILSKGRLFDRSFFWKKDLLKLATELISKHQIKNVICTIPPFRLAYYSAQLKDVFSDINYMVDYRDPWTDNKTFHEFNNLSSHRRQFELNMEKFAIDKANYVISSTNQMTKWAKEKTNNSQKCLTISNGYDEDDIVVETNTQTKKDKNTFLFAGTLYNDLEYIFIPFLNVIKKMESNDVMFHQKNEFIFYGHISQNLLNISKSYTLKSLRFHDFIPIHEIRQHYVNANYFMMFSVKDHAFAFNTKFYEYLSYKKPIIHFSTDGEVSQFIESNKIGIGINSTDIEQKMAVMFAQIKNNQFSFNQEFDVSPFSIKNITKELTELLV